MIQTIRDGTVRLVTRPVEELGHVSRTVRWAVDLFWHCGAELYYDRATEMAAALTYRTIFSLIPLLVMALLVFNAFGGFRGASAEAQETIYGYLGLSHLAVPAAGATAPPAAESDDADTQAAKQEVRARVDHLISQLTENVSALSLRGIGLVGLVVLIWAAIVLITAIEDCFNRVYDCPTGRPWHLRIPIYWAVITLGPVLIFTSLYLTQVFLNWTAEFGGVLGWLVAQLTQFAALAASWLLLYLLYTLMPYTHVERRPALIGSFVTAVLYEAGKWGFGLYVARLVPYSKLYGAMALLPLFLFWLYLTWLIVLFGLELTYALQAMKGRRFKYLARNRSQTTLTDPRWMVPIMLRIARGFAQGQTTSVEQLSLDLDLPPRSVAELARHLIAAGVIHEEQSNERSGLTLSMPADKIAVGRLLELGRSIGQPSRREGQARLWKPLDHIRQRESEAAGAATVADLLRQTETA